nr:hypothetical protein Iba_chr10eCG9200 [Ipomoea batatas]
MSGLCADMAEKCRKRDGTDLCGHMRNVRAGVAEKCRTCADMGLDEQSALAQHEVSWEPDHQPLGSCENGDNMPQRMARLLVFSCYLEPARNGDWTAFAEYIRRNEVREYYVGRGAKSDRNRNTLCCTGFMARRYHARIRECLPDVHSSSNSKWHREPRGSRIATKSSGQRETARPNERADLGEKLRNVVRTWRYIVTRSPTEWCATRPSRICRYGAGCGMRGVRERMVPTRASTYNFVRQTGGAGTSCRADYFKPSA